jgi:hypothetical protein
MAAISFAIIGKNNEPLYLKEFDDSLNTSISEEEFFGVSLSTPRNQISLKHEFLLHAALDRLEQVAGPPPGYGWRKSSDSLKSGMFVGLLCPHEEVRVYGYVTTTKIVFLLTVEDDSVPEMQQSIDNEIKSLMVSISVCTENNSSILRLTHVP